MSVITIEGDPKQGGIPRHSKVRLEALPGRTLVWRGPAHKSFSLNLDPGKYVYSVNRHTADKQGDLKYVVEFYHEMTEEQWKRIQHMRPRLCKAVHTTTGVVYRCRFVGCEEDSLVSATAAVLHEAKDHFGINLLEDASPGVQAEVADRAEDLAANLAKAERDRRRNVAQIPNA